MNNHTELDKQAAQTSVLIGKFLGECFKLRGLPRVVKDLELIMPTMQLLIEEQFQAFASQVREQSKWVNVASGDLPKEPTTNGDPEFVLVKWTEVERGKAGKSASGYDVCFISWLLDFPELITHWQLLPAPPQRLQNRVKIHKRRNRK